MKLRLLLFISFLFSVSGTFAQQTISGAVKDDNGKPISNAHILDINSRKAVAADQFGQFELAIADTGTVLRISHVGFRPVLRTISPDFRFKKRTVQLVLSEESTLLTVAEVTAGEKTVINGKLGVVLRDFSFANGNILLMAEDGVRYVVACDENWKEVSRLRVDKKGYRLYEDCFENTHLFGEDSVYQITIENGKVELSYTFSQEYFLEQMAHCSASTDSHVFFSSYQKAGQEVYHYGLHRETKEGTILQRVYDHEGLEDITDYFARRTRNPRPYRTRVIQAGGAFRFDCLEQPMVCRNEIGNNDYGFRNFGSYYPDSYRYTGTPAAQEQSTLLWGGRYDPDVYGTSQANYFKSVSNRALEWQNAMMNTWSPSPRDRGWIDLLSQPTYSPMFNLRDSIYVFDHVVGVCYVHDSNGNEVRSFPLEHQEHKGWRNLLVPDENGEKVYAHVKRKSKVYLMEVDLNTGKLVSSAYLKHATFVEHLKVKNGYAYYLKEYRDIDKHDQMMRQKL